MKTKLTTKQEFNDNTTRWGEQYETLHKAELKIQQLERIIEGLVVWEEKSVFYNEAYLEALTLLNNEGK